MRMTLTVPYCTQFGFPRRLDSTRLFSAARRGPVLLFGTVTEEAGDEMAPFVSAARCWRFYLCPRGSQPT